MPITAETRKQIFDKLKHGLDKCVPPMVMKSSVAAGACSVTGNTPVPYGHDNKIIPGMYFASIAQRKDSVSFYFFPAYMDPALKAQAPVLFKCLKGKTCFHFKSPEQIDEKELSALLKSGMKAWKKAGYVK